MAILALNGALLFAAAQPPSVPAAQPAPAASLRGQAPAAPSEARLGGVKVGAGDVNAAGGKVHEPRPSDFAPAPSRDPTALLLPAKPNVREHVR